jgi:hypothetical protein
VRVNDPSGYVRVIAGILPDKLVSELIVHDQASVPLDLESGRALLNLEP